ncbi:MAG: DUF3467 domain-containing protein [Candidatus Aenigmatarchaeota archaeon]
MEKKRVNVSIDNGRDVFFTDNVTIIHSPAKFVIDFTQTTPRFDNIGGEQQQSVIVKHNTVMMDPVLAKMFMEVLDENVKKYEKQHGKIKIEKGKTDKKSVPLAFEPGNRYIG